jgi:hypothetical protein
MAQPRPQGGDHWHRHCVKQVYNAKPSWLLGFKRGGLGVVAAPSTSPLCGTALAGVDMPQAYLVCMFAVASIFMIQRVN